MRKTPIKHKVHKFQKNNGTVVNDYIRGNGTNTQHLANPNKLSKTLSHQTIEELNKLKQINVESLEPKILAYIEKEHLKDKERGFKSSYSTRLEHIAENIGLHKERPEGVKYSKDWEVTVREGSKLTMKAIRDLIKKGKLVEGKTGGRGWIGKTYVTPEHEEWRNNSS